MNPENQERDASLSKLAAAIFIGSYLVSSWLSLELYNPPISEPFDNPPWYFIRQDAVHGLSFLPLFIGCVIAIFVAVRRNYPRRRGI